MLVCEEGDAGYVYQSGLIIYIGLFLTKTDARELSVWPFVFHGLAVQTLPFPAQSEPKLLFKAALMAKD